MSILIPEVYQTAYSANVHKAFQKSSLLTDTVRQDGKMIGNKIVFRKSGKLTAQNYNLGSSIIPGNTKYGNVPLELSCKYASDNVYDASKPNFNFQESEIISSNIGDAMGRCKDQIIIDDALAKTTTPIIGNADTFLSLKMINQLVERFNDYAIPMKDRFLVLTPLHLSMIINSCKYMSDDYSVACAIRDGKESVFHTFNIKIIESRDEGGLRPDVAVADSSRCYAYSKQCIGYAENKDITPTIERLPDLKAYQHTLMAWIGAVNIDDTGIIKINTANSIDGMTGADDALAVKIVNPEDFPTA